MVKGANRPKGARAYRRKNEWRWAMRWLGQASQDASAVPHTGHCTKDPGALCPCHAQGTARVPRGRQLFTATPVAATRSEDRQLSDCSCLSCLPGRFVGGMPDAQAAYRHHNANESSGVHCHNRRCLHRDANGSSSVHCRKRRCLAGRPTTRPTATDGVVRDCTAATDGVEREAPPGAARRRKAPASEASAGVMPKYATSER